MPRKSSQISTSLSESAAQSEGLKHQSQRQGAGEEERGQTRAARDAELHRMQHLAGGDDEADDLLKWADGIDLANISQEWG